MNADTTLLAAGLTAGVSAAAGVFAAARGTLRLGAGTRTGAAAEGDARLAAGGRAVVLAGLGEACARHGFAGRAAELEQLVGRAGEVGERSGREVLGEGAALALVAVPALGLTFASLAGPVGGAIGLAFGALLFVAPGASLKARAEDRMRRLRADLPFALDLMGLCVRAGGGLAEAIEAVRDSAPDAPLSIELGTVAADVDAGASFARALRRMASRLEDGDVDTMVDTFVQGEELGLPLAGVLDNLADTVRARRFERADAAANESSVRMLGPSMVVMVAVLILFLFPIVMSLLVGGPF